MKKKRTSDIIIIAIFFAVSVFFTLATLLIGASAGGREKLSSAPALVQEDGGINLGYTDELSSYFSDNFAFRSRLIDANSRLLTGFFSTSPVEKVIYGEDGWLFFSETRDDYLGTSIFTPRQRYSATRSLYLMQEYAESLGARFIFVPAPNKNSIYGDFMPYEGTDSPSNLDEFLSELELQRVNSIDLRGILQRDEALYFKGDSHWNTLGAAIAADAINAELGVETALEAGMEAGADFEGGDLFEMLYPATAAFEADFAYSPGFSFEYQSPFRSPEDISIATTRSELEGNLLMFRDSFGNSLYSFMAESFGSAFFSRANNYRLDFIDQKQADFVVIEIVERNLYYLCRYPAVFPAPERFLSENPLSGNIKCVLGLEDSELVGYIKFAGEISGGAIDDDSPIYISAGGRFYEASPSGGADGLSFTAYLPEGLADVADALVLAHSAGALTACSQNLS